MHTLLAAETSSDKDAGLTCDTHHGQDRTFTDVNLLSGRAGDLSGDSTCCDARAGARHFPLSVARVPRDGISD